MSRIIRWAGVEFQADLLAPAKPVRLGAVLLESGPSGASNIVVIGRMPIISSRPPEFEGVGDIMMELASAWVDHMFKDVLETNQENIFDGLSQRWKWNLYLIEAKSIRGITERDTFEAIAKRYYQQFVGLRFQEIPARRPPRPHSSSPIPPAWQLEEFKRRRLSQALHS